MKLLSELKYQDLPDQLPIFPLTAVLLLPGGLLPLNIFEPRYIAMVDNALKSDRLIGMIQPKHFLDENEKQGQSEPDLYSIGCAGRITSFNETADGRYEILLSGLSRFEIENSSLTEHGYRSAKVDWSSHEEDIEFKHDCELDRDELNVLLKKYFKANEIKACWETIQQTPDRMLLTALSMICPFTPQEKQLLLESKDCDERAERLRTLLQMSVAGSDCGQNSSTC